MSRCKHRRISVIEVVEQPLEYTVTDDTAVYDWAHEAGGPIEVKYTCMDCGMCRVYGRRARVFPAWVRRAKYAVENRCCITPHA